MSKAKVAVDKLTKILKTKQFRLYGGLYYDKVDDVYNAAFVCPSMEQWDPYIRYYEGPGIIITYSYDGSLNDYKQTDFKPERIDVTDMVNMWPEAKLPDIINRLDSILKGEVSVLNGAVRL